MRKRSAYRPKPINPLAYLVARDGVLLMSRDDVIRFSLPLHAAVDSARSGAATADDWRLITAAINVLEQLVRAKVAKDPDNLIGALHDQIGVLMVRIRVSNVRALWADELALLRNLASTYADVLAQVTQAELFRAQEAVAERMGRALRGQDMRAVFLPSL